MGVSSNPRSWLGFGACEKADTIVSADKVAALVRNIHRLCLTVAQTLMFAASRLLSTSCSYELIHAQRRQRINARSSSRGQITRQGSSSAQQHTHREKRDGIGGPHAVQQIRQHSSQQQGHRNADRQSRE